MAHLILIEEGNRNTYKLDRKVTYIGRKNTCDIAVEDTNVSRHHARIINDSNDYLLVDTQSRNGTYVNGQKTSQTFLTDDDHIRIGTKEFRFFLDPEDKKPVFQLSKYEIIEKIGRGGMGIVYKARQKSMDRIVALKILHERLVNDSAFVDRFIREAQAAGKLSHPNIIHVHDVSKEKGFYYFSMEFVSGSTVTSRLMDKGHLPSNEVLDIVKQVAKALGYAHGNNLIHRDIKPDNIMITDDGEVKLADLGIARNLKESSANIEKNTIYGTPLYMSPEQALGMELDGRTDIYSLGATAFHIATGETPFEAEKAIDVLKKHINDPLPPPDSINPDIPDDICRLIEIMMAKEPEERFQSAVEIVEEIEQIQKGGNVSYKRTPLHETAILKRLSSGIEVEPSVNIVDFPSDKRIEHLASLDPKKRKTTFFIILFIIGLIGAFICTVYISDIFKRHISPREPTFPTEQVFTQAEESRAEGNLAKEYSLLLNLYKNMPLNDERRIDVKNRLQDLAPFIKKQDRNEIKSAHLKSYTSFIKYAASNPGNINDIITQGRRCLTSEFMTLFPDRTENIRSIIKTYEKRQEDILKKEENDLFEAIISQDNTGPEGFIKVKRLASDYLRKFKDVNPAHLKIVMQERKKAIQGEKDLVHKNRKRQIANFRSDMESAYTNRRFPLIYQLYKEFINREEIKNTKWEIEAEEIFKHWSSTLNAEFKRRQNEISSKFNDKEFRIVLNLTGKLVKDFAKTEFSREAYKTRSSFAVRIRKNFSDLKKRITEHRSKFEYYEARMIIIKESQNFMETMYQNELETVSAKLEQLEELWDYLLTRGEKINIILPIIIINMREKNVLRGIKSQGVFLKPTADDLIPPNFVKWEELTDEQIYEIFKSILVNTQASSEYYKYLSHFCTFRNLKGQLEETQHLYLETKETEEEAEEEEY